MERPPGCDLEQPRETCSMRCSYAIYLNFSKSGFQDRLVNSNIFEFFQVDYKTGLKQTVFIGNIIEFSQVNRKACSLLNLDKLYLLGIYLVFCKSISGHCKQKKNKRMFGSCQSHGFSWDCIISYILGTYLTFWKSMVRCPSLGFAYGSFISYIIHISNSQVQHAAFRIKSSTDKGNRAHASCN